MPEQVVRTAIREELEHLQHEADANLLRLLDDSTDAIAMHRENKIVYANPAGLKLFGYERADQVIGRSPLEFVSLRFREIVQKRMFKSYAGGVTGPEIEESFLDVRGREVPVEVLAIPLTFQGKTVTLVHIRDITKRKELEAKLAAADRLASVGFVAAAVVHQINNPLAWALNNVEQLQKRLDKLVPPEQLGDFRAMCDAVHEGLHGVLDVVRDVKIFSEDARVRPRMPVDVHEVLDSVANLVEFELRGRARLVKRYADEVPTVVSTPARLGQVLANVLINAAQAIPPGNEEANSVTVVTSVNGPTVVIEIQDTGPGVPPELRQAIFDPLFTTKDHGTGLGLAISRTMLSEEGGSITLKEDAGGGGARTGSTFVVTLRAISTSQK